MSVVNKVDVLQFIKPRDRRFKKLMSDSMVPEYSKNLISSGEFENIAAATAAAIKEIEACVQYSLLKGELNFYEIIAKQARVGYIWFIDSIGQTVSCSADQAFLAYIYINKAHRRNAYARQALQFYEQTAMAMGNSESKLCVFKHNLSAIALYQSQGYQIKNNIGFYDEQRTWHISRFEMRKLLGKVG